MIEILVVIIREIIQGIMERLFLKYNRLTFGLIVMSWGLSSYFLAKIFLDAEWWKILLVSGVIAIFVTFFIELFIYLISKVVEKFK